MRQDREDATMRHHESEVERLAGRANRAITIGLILILVVVGGFLLVGVASFLFCCGVGTSFMGRQEPPVAQAQLPAHDAPVRARTYRLNGTVLIADPLTKTLSLNHEGIPGVLPAASNRFDVKDANCFNSIRQGMRVACTVEVDGQSYLITGVTSNEEVPPRKPDGLAPKGPVPQRKPDDPRLVKRLEGHGSLVNCVAFSPDGRLAVSGSGMGSFHSDNTVRVWDLGNGKELCRLEGHTDRVLCVAFSPDGSQVVSGSADKTISVWDIKAKKEVRRLDGHASEVLSVAFSADGKQVLSAGGFSVNGSHDATIRVWDAGKGQELRKLDCREKKHTFFFSQIAFAPDGKLALVQPYGTDELSKSIRAYNLENGNVERTFTGHTEVIRCVGLSPDGRHAISSGYDLSIRFWDVKTGEQLKRFPGPREKVICIAISPDNKRALSDHANGTVHLWDLETGQELLSMRHGQNHYVDARHNIVFSPDGKTALSAAQNQVLLWDVEVK
jgi:WD40 repeat protein